MRAHAHRQMQPVQRNAVRLEHVVQQVIDKCVFCHGLGPRVLQLVIVLEGAGFWIRSQGMEMERDDNVHILVRGVVRNNHNDLLEQGRV